VNNRVIKYFSVPISSEDESILSTPRGSSEGQQVWESLVVLIAVRLWLEYIQAHRVSLQVRGDNVGALMLLIKMRPRTPTLAIIARELALSLAFMAFPPKVMHTPGIAHKLADHLSRTYSASGAQVVTITHHALEHAVRDTVPTRGVSWYRTLDSAYASVS
jgi:hypothetical protein